MKSDLAFRDVPQYLNSSRVFAEAYNSYADWYNRTYMPLGVREIKV
ncbi:MAG: hypothetical protein IJD22_01530 [Clostridia bacterium]|nr:hypothetical protein [Clostridia bacterium]